VRGNAPPFTANIVLDICANAVQNSLAISNLNVHGYTELP
jgi:hypothetical protein